MGETRDLSKFLADLKYEKLPKEIVNKAKRLILDYLGYAMSASTEDTAKILFELIKRYNGGVRESTVLGYGIKTSCLNAAFLNGAMGHLCEMDDTHRFTMSHPGDSVISSALAVAEREGSDGKSFLTAVVAGYEAALRIGDAVCPSHYAKGWHTTGTICTFGAAVAAGKILEFDTDQMENALGLAGVQVAGMFGTPPSEKMGVTYMTKDFRPGKAALNGVLAALLTEIGFTGNPGILETKRGFCALYADEYDLKKVTEGIGEKFKIMEVAHKPYSACRYIHAGIDATLELMDKYEITKDNIKNVIVESYCYVAIGMDNPNPVGRYGPRFSIQFQLAHTIVEGRAGLKRIMAEDTYAMEKRKAPEIVELMKKVKTVYKKDLDREWPDKWTTIVRIKTIGGKEHSCRVDFPKGEPENDLTAEELNEKFRILASRLLDHGKVGRIMGDVYGLEEIMNIRNLTELLLLPKHKNSISKIA